MLGSRWPVPPSALPQLASVFSAHSLILSTSSWVNRSFVRSYSLALRGLSWPETCGSRSALAPLRKLDGVKIENAASTMVSKKERLRTMPIEP